MQDIQPQIIKTNVKHKFIFKKSLEPPHPLISTGHWLTALTAIKHGN